jgi:ElaB/YqjD/DUF883 family membrane-anchored ribosome-binding protein
MARKLNLISGEEGEAGDVAQQIEALRAEISLLAKSVSGLIAAKGSTIGSNLSARVSEGVERTAAQASELTHASMESLAQVSERAKDASLQVIDTLSAEVRRHPTRTLAITLGLGVLIGLMSRSR